MYYSIIVNYRPRISFVIKVTKVKAGQGLIPGVPLTRPAPPFGEERIRPMLLARHAARKERFSRF